jgi:lipid-binding SYLF domain-containing protein
MITIKEYGEALYAATAEIKPELITGAKGFLIMPRVLKTAEVKKSRTKTEPRFSPHPGS